MVYRTRSRLLQFTIAISLLALWHLNVSQAELPAKGTELNSLPGLSTRKAKTRDSTLAISVESVLRKLRKKEKIVLIDVRNRQDFKKFNIPDSINIPLFAIKTKLFLKSRFLVLVNEGYHYHPLEEECRRLRESGFADVWILRGGLSAWKQEGVPLRGDVFSQKELNRMPPQVFFEERNYENWLVIDASEQDNPGGRDLIPQSLNIPFGGDTRQFVSAIKKEIQEHKKVPLLSLLIFNENGDGYEIIEKAVKQAGIENVFYLKGGLYGYKTFLQRQALMWEPKTRSTKAQKKCVSCP